jgi:hypothetical protein
MKFRNRVRKFGAVIVGATAPLAAFATAPAYDVSDAETAITAGGVAIAALGVASLVLVVGLKVWKRLRGAA